ncbi:CPBP family intramembrane metalloprotease [Candidatus Saccharibacteria bacterium]|nr:CPBP family intramembrane metalloprotease [Candidatus Saccharibacteria bacterium]
MPAARTQQGGAWQRVRLATAVMLSMVAAYFGSMILAGWLVPPASSLPWLSGTAYAVVAGAVFYGLLAAVLLLLARQVFQAGREHVGVVRVRRWRYAVFLPGILLLYYLFSFLVSAGLLLLVPSAEGSGQDIGFHPQGTADLALTFFLLVVMAPLAEEFVFRGYFFGLLRRAVSFRTAAIIVSLLFGLVHVQDFGNIAWTLVIDTAALSLAACWLRERSGHIWFGVLLHSLKNLVAFVLLFIVNISAG